MARSLVVGYAGLPGSSTPRQGVMVISYQKRGQAEPWRGYLRMLGQSGGFLRDEGDIGTVRYQADRVRLPPWAGV